MVAQTSRDGRVDPATPLDEAARRILRKRLGAVRRLVKKSRGKGARDAEIVHDLRSSIRRASAAIDLLSSAVRPRRASRMQALLERIRGAAGRARDRDVSSCLLEELRPTLSPGELAAADWTQRRLDRGRKRALRRLREESGGVRRRLRAGRLLRRSDQDSTLRDAGVAAETTLRSQAAAAMSGDLHKPEDLHQVRIVLRQLRYTLEAAAPDDPRIEELKTALGALGRVGDMDALRRRIEKESARAEPGIARGLADLIARCSALRGAAEAEALARLGEIHWWADEVPAGRIAG